MPRRYTEIFSVDQVGKQENRPDTNKVWDEVKGRDDRGRLRKRPGLVLVDSDSTPAVTAGVAMLMVEHEPSDTLDNEEIIRPDADGNYDDYDGTPWSVSGGGAEGYSKIDEETLDTGDYIQNTQNAALDTTKNSFTFADLVATFDSISHVKVTLVAKDMQPADHSNTYTLNVFARQGGSDYELVTYDETDFPFNTQVTKEIVLYNSPDDSSAWVDADVDGFEVGFYFSAYSEGASGATVFRIYQLYVTVVGEVNTASGPNTKIMVVSQGFQALNESLDTWSDISGSTSSPAQPTKRRWDWTEHANILYFANGSDDLYFYPISGGSTMDELTGKPTGRCIATFGQRLVIGDYLESSVRNYDGIRWPNVTDMTDWSGGDAGNLDLDETPGRLVALVPIAEKATSFIGVLVGLKRQGLYHIETDATDVFKKRLMVGSVGCYAVNTAIRTVLEGRDVVAFLGHEGNQINILAWDGNNIIPLGDPVKNEIADEINWDEVENAFAGHDHVGGNLVFAIATGSNDYPTKAWVYNVERKTWKVWDLPEVTTFGVWKVNGQWQQVVGKSDRRSYKFDVTAVDDQGSAAITQEFRTGALVLDQEQPWRRTTIYRAYVWYRSRGTTTLTTDVSTDGGTAYDTSVSTTLDSDNDDDGSLKLAKVDLNTNGYTQMIRFKNATAGEELDVERIILEWEPRGQ